MTEATPESFLYIRTHIPSDDAWCFFSHARNSSDDENSRIGNSVPLFFIFSEHLLDLDVTGNQYSGPVRCSVWFGRVLNAHEV